ncbi:helix-turn-helix domain-containing protein [Niveispirillum sp. BGYR6]|uniref:helix-turn-helix domain-containing protein n=1 Tax=Niveispirillum sp. BGYR6 TaxID=2971249 RepID=UPI000B6E77FF|nr:helix-turn-helix domain-containing protein [Niveispirillum sp. BGYR6]MDG5496989.1 helix-turn-helix domain-containing protein [Niveispirillum sp. BGYR6]SNS84190.1 DNA binding domain-containing protein, excisionase family [Azospirillum sp. RU38E]SNT01487.1 DNA binding domain-containing protein, excisionase family [Azospirillum sp. RU37A]
MSYSSDIAMNDRNLSTVQVSHWLQVPVRTVTSLAVAGALPGAFRVGRHWRFSEKQLLEWRNGQWAASTSAQAAGSGGSDTLTSMEKLYVDLLKPKSKKKLGSF